MTTDRPIAVDALEINLTVNDQPYKVQVEARKTLADMLREDIGTTGVRVGCEQGVCGSCTVLFDGVPTRACLLLGVQADGHDIKTVESLASGDRLHEIQQAFTEEHALQCGFCTAGIMLSVASLLEQDPNPTDEQIYEMLGGHLCRCTGYQQIVNAVKRAARNLEGPLR